MKVSKRIGSIILSVLMIVSTLVPMSVVTASAAAAPVLSVDKVTAESGTEVHVAVKLKNASGVYNGNFTLQYDSSKLEAVSYSYGNIFNEHTRNCNLNYQSTGNQIRFTFSGAYALTGDGTLVTFTFNVKENVSGNAALNFTAYKMYDENGLSLSPTATNGNIDISAKETAKPELFVIGGTVNAGETISVPVKIINTASVYNGNFTLQYDSSKLEAVSYTYGSIFNEHTKNCNLDYQSTGNQIRFTFSGAYPLTGDGTLVTFNFKAKQNVSGNATLNFTAYKMYDENGISLSPTAVNGSIEVSEKSLSSISIFTQPTKHTYYAGDYLDPKGLQLKLTYSDGSSEIVSSRYTTNLDGVPLDAGTKNVIVTYQGLTTTFSINVQNISGTVTPSSLDLIVGDTYTLTSSLQAPEDAILTWVTSDNSVVTVSNGVVRAVGIGTAKVYVSINNNGFITASEFCTVTVSKSPAVLKSISISSNPTKTIYEIGESLDTSGLRLKLNYNDGSSEIISSGFTTSGFSSTTAGTKTVTVSYGGKTTSFNVTVKNYSVDTGAPYLTMDSIVTSSGKEITLSLLLKNNPGIAGLAVSLNYDENVLTLKEVSNGNLFDAFTYGKNYIWDDSKNITSDGVLATFVFSVSDDAAAGDYAIDIISRSCVNIDLEDVKLLSVNPTISIRDFQYGDANGDGRIDMKDVVLLRKYMANYDYDTETSSEDVEVGADANGDGSIDMKDVVLIRKYLANYDYDTDSSSVVLGPQ